MTSVDELAANENYLEIAGMTEEKRPVVKIFPLKRDWSRQNYELDLRYVESVLWGACAMMPEHVQKMVIECDCSELSIIRHYAPNFFNKLVSDLRLKFKERVYEIRLVRPSISASLLFWLYKNEFPYSFTNKLKWTK